MTDSSTSAQLGLAARKRTSEQIAIDAVLRDLVTEGFSVEQVTHPDREPHSGRAPDAALLLDGRAAAIEVVQFRVSQAKNDATAMSKELAAILNHEVMSDDSDPPGTLLPIVLYDPAKLLRTKRRQRLRDTLALASSMSEALRNGVDPFARHEIYPNPDWVVSASVVRQRSRSRATRAYMDSLGHNIQAVVDDFMRWVVQRKGAQHLAYGKGVLAIQQRWLEDPENLREACSKLTGPSPWWRIYLVDRGARAILVG